MKLATFIVGGTDHPQSGEVRGDEVVAFSTGTVLDRLAGGDRTPADGARHALADVTLLAPVPRPPAIFCIGRNYAAHIAELGSEKPEKPLVFLKLPLSSVPPAGPVKTPKATQALDYEVELVLVMGPENEIAGYAVANDVSARDLQRSEAQWSRAKGFDSSCPWGPWITTDADPSNLRLTTHVNGELRQDGSTSDLIFKPEELVGLHLRGLHARAGRDHPHGHAERRRRGLQAAEVPAARRHGPLRGRGPRRHRAPIA